MPPLNKRPYGKNVSIMRTPNKRHDYQARCQYTAYKENAATKHQETHRSSSTIYLPKIANSRRTKRQYLGKQNKYDIRESEITGKPNQNKTYRLGQVQVSNEGPLSIKETGLPNLMVCNMHIRNLVLLGNPCNKRTRLHCLYKDTHSST